MAMSQRAQGKHSCWEAFTDENKAEAESLAALAGEKHAQKMAEYAQQMVELDIKKQRIDLEATEKQLQAEDHRLTAQHQQEHEKEAHNLQMFCLCLQYQGAAAMGVGLFGTQQFSAAYQFEDSNMLTGSSIANPREGLFLPPFNG